MSPRLGAGNYVIALSSSVIAWSIGTLAACDFLPSRGYFGQVTVVVSLLGTMLGVVFYAASARRLRDLNFPGWSVKVLAFPLIGVMVLPVLCFLSGQRWENRYGLPQERSGLIKIAVALVLSLVASQASFAALTTYYEIRREIP